MSSGSDSNSRLAKEQARTEEQRQSRIKLGTADVRSMFAQNFGNDFYNGVKQNFSNYYEPKLEQQIGDSNRQLTGALSRGGNLNGMVPEIDPQTGRPTGRYVPHNKDAAAGGMLGADTAGGSTVGVRKFDDLQNQQIAKRVELVDRANQEVSNKRGSVQQAQNNVIMQLQSTADASGAAADAASMSKSLQSQNAYEPLGQVFTDATFGLATQADLERRGDAKFNTGWFPKTGSSGQTVG